MLANGVKQTTTSTGTGNLTLSAVTNMPKFSDVFPLNVPFSYTLVDSNNLFIEAGVGYLSDAQTLVRSRITSTYANGVYTTVSPSAANLSGTTTVIGTPSASTIETMMPTVDGTSPSVNRDITSAGRVVATSNSAVTALRVYYVPFLLRTAAPITSLGTFVTTQGAAGAVTRLGIYSMTASGAVGSLLATTGDIDVSTTGYKMGALTSTVQLAPGWYYTAFVSSGAPSVVCYSTSQSNMLGGSPLGFNSSSSFVMYEYRYETATSAVLPAVASGSATGVNVGSNNPPVGIVRVQ